MVLSLFKFKFSFVFCCHVIASCGQDPDDQTITDIYIGQGRPVMISHESRTHALLFKPYDTNLGFSEPFSSYFLVCFARWVVVRDSLSGTWELKRSAWACSSGLPAGPRSDLWLPTSITAVTHCFWSGVFSVEASWYEILSQSLSFLLQCDLLFLRYSGGGLLPFKFLTKFGSDIERSFLSTSLLLSLSFLFSTWIT